ncbi:hypothetical protein GCM10023093_02740 [Nemorincola caseinilytica]|uniref:Uncharacterized protein n=1 Tax=Nemorincola caseinilytica TaxID=2054315 RepID=A0ABP8N769_9BACT
MRTHKHIAAILATFFCYAATAQMVDYKTDDQTKKLAPVKVGLTLAFASGNQIGAGGIVQGCLMNKLFYGVEYRKVLVRGFSNAGVAATGDLQTTQTEKSGRYMEAGAEWAIRDKMDQGKMRIVTSSNMTSERYFHATCDLRKLITVGGGFFSYGHNYYMERDSAHYFTSGTQKLQPAQDKIFHSYISTAGFFGGVSFRKIKKAAVSSGGYRYRNFKATSWSFQVLSGPSKMQDITVGGVTYPINNANSAPLGYRVIWRADRGPSSTCVELGKMPHIAFSNDNLPDLSLFGPEGISSFVNHFRLSFNFILYGNDRKYGLKQKKSKN